MLPMQRAARDAHAVEALELHVVRRRHGVLRNGRFSLGDRDGFGVNSCWHEDGAQLAVRAQADFLDFRLRFPQLSFTVPLQRRAPFIGGNGVVEPAFPVLQAADDLLQLSQRISSIWRLSFGKRSDPSTFAR